MSTGNIKQVWRLLGPSLVLLLMLTLVLYQHTLLYLVSLWNQLDVGEYAHGYVVLAISGYLILTNRQRLFALLPRPEYRAFIVVVAASMLWMVAALVDVEMIQALGLLLLVLGLVWAILGNQVIRVLVFPILFIGFAIPVWFPLSPILQNLAADSVFWAIRLLSIPALRQENMIVLPAGTLSIEETCSGLRYLLAALTLGALYAYTNYSSWRARLLVVLVSAGSAILVNILRIFIVVYLGYTTDMQHPLVDDHLSLGWYLFAGLVVILMLLDVAIHKARLPVQPAEPFKQKQVTTPVECKRSFLYYFLLIVGSCLLVSIAPAIIHQTSQQQSAGTVNVEIDLSLELEGWSSVSADNDTWLPVYHGAVNHKQFFQKDSNEVMLYVGYYPAQSQGKELINDLNRINNHDIWRTAFTRARLQSVKNQQVLEQLLVNDMKKQRLVWYWYNIAGKVTTNRYKAKMLQVWGLLTGKSWAYVVAIAAPTDDDVDKSRQVLSDYFLSAEQPIENMMDRVTLSN